ncbi:protein Dml1p [[Candida] railenensis]|uniref:Protein DML1 n=1 Tax=[Candida] railenensis TaxID=45579 RepID=A0A9P0QPY3_9ASCO|nr:protein Dml1p [[Candida] railenensis]
MHETITLGLSQNANHIATHLYNNQESHLSYKKGSSSNYDNLVYLTSTRNFQGTINYNPRAILYELNGGIGALGKFDYYGPEIRGMHEEERDEKIGKGSMQNVDTFGESDDLFKPFPKIEKNSYQKALDSGSVKQGMLTVENTKYWSDYNKLIYKPSSLNTLTDWVHDPASDASFGHSRNGEQSKFSNYYVGVNEYNSKENVDHTETFRSYLEDCDLFQGMNILTEVDSGWGGFTDSYLTEIKDEYFNNGGDSKYSFWNWAIYNNNLTMDLDSKLSRVKTTIALIKNSTLYFGVTGSPDYKKSSGIINQDNFKQSSLWHSSAVKSLLIDNLWTIGNQNSERISMNQFESELLRGNTSRNIVGDINIHSESKAVEDRIENMMIDVSRNQINDLYASAASEASEVGSSGSKGNTESNPLDFTNEIYKPLKPSKYFSKSYIIPINLGVDLAAKNKAQLSVQEPFPITEYNIMNPSTITSNYTFPQDIIREPTSIYTEFGISSKPKDLLKDYKLFLQRTSKISNRGGYKYDNFDIDELVEDVNGLIEEYTYDWESEDEEWD